MTDQDPQARISELERDLAASEADTRTMMAAYETRLPPEHVDQVAAVSDVGEKIALAQRLAGQPAAPASHARAPRDGLGRFAARPGFGGGVAPSGEPFSGHPPGEHPVDRAIRGAAEHPRSSA